MTQTIGVASIPISVFYSQKTDPKILRFCFAKEDSQLEEALDKLQKMDLFG
jgi:methionine aminotransferase